MKSAQHKRYTVSNNINASAQTAVTSVGAAVPDVVVILAVSLVALATWWRLDRRRTGAGRDR